MPGHGFPPGGKLTLSLKNLAVGILSPGMEIPPGRDFDFP